MDPTTEIVRIIVEDGPTQSFINNINSRRVWGLAFPDLADIAYYNDSDPITQMTDYALLFGTTGNSTSCFAEFPQVPLTQALLPNDDATCDALLTPNDHRTCWTELPNQSGLTYTYTSTNGVRSYQFEVDFKSCGYDFNPFEFQTCRPLTMRLKAGVDTDMCMYSLFSSDNFDEIQIDDFETRAPTMSPTLTPSSSPSTDPTTAPSFSPTFSPVNPTFSPTFPTQSPTLAPSSTPTAKPTHLPTANRTVYDQPECKGMNVRHLDLLFPDSVSNEKFNQVYDNEGKPLINDQRRVWSNGKLDIYYTDRFEQNGGGDWVITNGSYSAISIVDANFNNSLVYNISDSNAIAPHSLPGPFPFGYVYFDHFPHDNILSKPDEEVTLFFACNNTQFPTSDPTPSPTTAIPTSTPTTSVPTSAPTANCTALCITTVYNSECGETVDGNSVSDLFSGCFLKTNDMNDRAKWTGVDSEYNVYYSLLYSKWIVNGNDGYTAWIDGTQKYPPTGAEWAIFESQDPYDIDCLVRFNYVCFETGIPTKAPTISPTTLTPTTAIPSLAPSAAPSIAPSMSPSIAPSIAPSLAPTAAPIQNCSGLNLTGTDVFDGLYARNENNQISNRSYWEKIRFGPMDAKIFWSDSVSPQTWIINSPSNQRYWASESMPDLHPSLTNNQWSLYLGASPQIVESRNLELECFETLPPTRAPTDSPTTAPSLAPSSKPSAAPSLSPSSAPSAVPSSLPSESPTSLSPTTEPTLYPTSDPTMEPTTGTPTSTPTLAPSFSPSLAPTGSPTSSCLGLYFNNTDDANFEFNGWYRRNLDYLWNGRTHWKSVDGKAEIRFIGTSSLGQWVLSEFDSDNGDDEDPIMLTQNGQNLLSPPSGEWKYIDSNLNNASVIILCDATFAPSADPTLSPSQMPTEYVMPNWTFCPNDRTYFSFDSSSVYWPLPVLDNDMLNLTVTPNVVPGQNNNFNLGMTNINYEYYDAINDAKIDCAVTVYVIGGDKVNYEYCKEQKFHISVQFNDSYIEISGIDEESAQITEVVVGNVYDPLLTSEGANCFVTAEKVSIYQKVEIDDGVASSSILGFELANFLWEILGIVLIAILLCLILDCLWRKCRDRRNKNKAADAEQTENLLANQQEMNKANDANEVIELQEAQPENDGNDVIPHQETGGQLAEDYED